MLQDLTWHGSKGDGPIVFSKMSVCQSNVSVKFEL